MPIRDLIKEKERRKVYCQKNKERIREYRKKYYEANKERCKELNRIYRNKNKDLRKKYYLEHKDHIKKQEKKYYSEHREHIKKRYTENHFKYKYNLTSSQVEAMLISQDYLCLICHKPLINIKRCVDHDHKTGKVRGILCNGCNSGLSFIENTKCYREALNYLKLVDGVAEVEENIGRG